MPGLHEPTLSSVFPGDFALRFGYRVWHDGCMSRRKATVAIEESLLDAARQEAERIGTTEDEVIENALRRHLVAVEPSVVDEVWARNEANALTADEAMELAYAELKAMRAERQARQSAS